MTQETPRAIFRDISRRALPLALAVVVLGIWAASVLQAYPEPAIVPKGWSLDFTHGKPTPIAVRDPITDQYKWYWYIAYKVVNNTGKDQLFVPEVTIATEAGDIINAGAGVPVAVFPAIKAKERNKFLENPNLVVGRILQGEDYAKESVIVWPAFNHTANQVSVFVTGLSGESAVLPDPKTGEKTIFRKTLMINYFFPGTGVKPQDQPVVAKGETWVMR